jgi:hypothetical protein
MRSLRILALIAVGVSCHLDKLLNGGGGVHRLSTSPPVALVFSTLPHAPRAGPLGFVQISVVDSAGVPVVGAESTTVTVALGANPLGGTLKGTTSQHPTRGVATFSDLRLDRAASGYTLTATTGGLPTVTSDTFTVMPGPATQLTFTAEPNNVGQGGVVTPPVVVTAFDSLDNQATDFTGAVTLTLRQNGATVNGALSGATANAVAGVATFANLRISNAGQRYTLTAALGAAAPLAESTPFDVSPPGPPPPQPGSLAITTVTTGSNLPSGYTVTVDGNPAGTIGTSGSLTINPVTPGDRLVGLSAVPAICSVAGANPLTVSVPSGGSGHADFAISCGAPPSPPPPGSGPFLRFTDQPGIAQAGQPNRAVRVTIYDASGNKDVSFLGNVTLSIGFNPGGGSLTGGGTIVMQPGLGGTVQWDGPSIDAPGAGYTLHATCPGLRDAYSDPFDITAGPPPSPNGADGLGFFTQPTTTRAGEVINPLRVGALGPPGVVVPAYTGPIWISILSNASGATLTGTRHLYAVNGLVTFSDLRIDKPGTGYILRATAWPLNYVESVPFDVTP